MMIAVIATTYIASSIRTLMHTTSNSNIVIVIAITVILITNTSNSNTSG